ncbi:MAG: universal stress protein [Planctomycetes bacterium]|nr:universal stress protein [Planctomycetota bacterium]
MSDVAGAGKQLGPQGSEHSLRQLTPLLVWAVVFCDIGTSVYYVPGILYERVGDVAPFFVWIGLAGFILLAMKYVEICWRTPDGGGVVSIANKAFTPMVGAIGGLLISIGYFLTSAISSVSGIHYMASVWPILDEHVVAMAAATLILLAIINTIGIRESATLALVMAVSAFVVNLAVSAWVLLRMGEVETETIRQTVALAEGLDRQTFLVGFSTAWLAFSGLESISQLSPAMRTPLAKTAGKGMKLVVITMLVTSPVLTLLAVALLPAELKLLNSERFISEIGGLYGGWPMKLAVVVTGSALLLLAANTAIIGCYHVFLSLAEKGFMPSTIAARNRYFGTPQIAILVATLVPILVIWVAGGNMQTLAGLYAFGLLGAFLLSSAGLDVLRWRDAQRGLKFWLGVFTTLMVLVAWLVTLRIEGDATLYGTILVGLGLVLAVGTRRKWFADWLYNMPLLARIFPRRVERAEEALEHAEQLEILSLTQAESVAQLYPSSTMIAMRTANPGLISEAIAREKGRGGRTLYVLYVEERTGLFVRDWSWQPTAEGIDALRSAVQAAEAEGLTLIPVWTVSYNAVEGILRAAEALGVTAIMIGATQRSAIYHLLRGHVLAGLTKRLPPGIRLLIYG